MTRDVDLVVAVGSDEAAERGFDRGRDLIELTETFFTSLEER